MKNLTEQLNLLRTRVAEALDSKNFRHILQHHTDLDIHKVERISNCLWITLKDGTYFKIDPRISKSPYKIPTPYNGLTEAKMDQVWILQVTQDGYFDTTYFTKGKYLGPLLRCVDEFYEGIPFVSQEEAEKWVAGFLKNPLTGATLGPTPPPKFKAIEATFKAIEVELPGEK